MKITIFTIANIRPDFIEIQYDSIKKFLKDKDFEYIIFNNAYNNPKRYEVIEDICKKLKIRSIKVNHKRDYNNDASQIVAAALNDMWQNHLIKMRDILFYIDSDMFLVKDISIEKLMNGFNFGFVPNYRGKDFEVMYAWTGLMFFNMNTLPSVEELVWDTGVVLGHRVDVGGLNHHYLLKYKNNIRILNLEMWNLNDIEKSEDGLKKITGSLNGNVKIDIILDKDDKLVKLHTPDFHLSDKRFFPYQKDDANYYGTITSNYLKFEKYLKSKKLNFPKPPYIDLFKTDTGTFDSCFIFHYKSGSNWLGFATDNYNQKKTIEFCKLMTSLGVKSNFKLLKEHKTFFVEEDKQSMFKPNIIKRLIKKILNKIKSFRENNQVKPKIYDIFTFFNELDLLEIRLNVLDPYVDYFVIVESNQTFSGQDKSLYFKENKDRFAKWNHKIIHQVVDDYPKDKDIVSLANSSPNVPKDGPAHWHREFYQKESIKKALVGLNDDDICFVGDVDEIWNYNKKYNLGKKDVFKLKLKVYSYFLNNRSDEDFAGTIVTKYKNIKNNCLNHLRSRNLRYLHDGGWHFTNMGGLEQIRRKLDASYTKESYNTPDVQQQLEGRIRENKDYMGRVFKFLIDESDLPEYILKNRNRYEQYFK